MNNIYYIKDDFFKHYSSKAVKDPNYERDRERFVLSNEKMYEYQRWLENVKKLHEMAEESKRKQQAEKEQ